MQVLGDLIESSLGALFLDCGFNLNHVWSVMLSVLDPVKNLSNLQLSPVKELIELCQSHKWDREISVTKKDGAFCIELKVTKKGCCITASATGRNKIEGTKKAAQLMITNLKVIFLRVKRNSCATIFFNLCGVPVLSYLVFINVTRYLRTSLCNSSAGS